MLACVSFEPLHREPVAIHPGFDGGARLRLERVHGVGDLLGEVLGDADAINGGLELLPDSLDAGGCMSNVVKKSFNLSADLAQRLDDFIAENPGLSLTLIMQQALDSWLRNPQLTVRLPKTHTNDDVDAVLSDNAALMDDLAK
jgi:hypothetical protein